METLDRKNVMRKAIEDCFREMYAKSQPSADWDKLVEDYKNGIISKDEMVYEQHYLSKEEFDYILDKYISAYGFKTHWKDDIEILERYLTEGGLKDKYVPEETDEDGHYHPGYRDAERVKPLKDQIKEYLCGKLGVTSGDTDTFTEDITKIVMDNIGNCKNFYKFDREESDFKCAVCLGASPIQNPETVKKYWKEKTGEDLQIVDRIPCLFWYYDNGYSDDDLAYEFEDYGENWKEKLMEEWKEEVHKEKEDHDKKMKALQKEMEALNQNIETLQKEMEETNNETQES